MGNQLTILVNSCDLYEDAWMPFLKLLKIHWSTCSFPIVINTENKDCRCDFLPVRTIKTGKKSWTARLVEALHKIDTDFVLFFLEDFFLYRDVDVIAFDKAFKMISNDPEIGLIHYTPVEKIMPESKHDLENCFYVLPIRRRTLRTRVAVSLFRKEYFLKLLYKDESPWQYERESHIRSMFAGFKIIRQSYELYPPTFYYSLDHDIGIGITARKWLPKTKELFEINGIYGVNFDNLGILTNEEKERQNKEFLNIKNVGFRNYLYTKFIHPMKRRIRHIWLLQDIINIRKYLKYWLYYNW